MTRGFADLHNHQFANLGFGGEAFWGSPYGSTASALPHCDPVHGAGGTTDIIGNTLRALTYSNFGLAMSGHKVGGDPEFNGWPRWDSLTHQSVHEDMLYRSVLGGMRLMTMLAVSNEFLCGLANKAPGRGCSDMEAVDLQLQAAKNMETYIDNKSGGPGQGWYRIVYEPEEAQAVIDAGKLAVVLGIEVDYLFGCHNEADLTTAQLEQQLDNYHAMGVRQVFPIHFGNNGFGGTAFQNGLENDRGAGAASARNPAGTLSVYSLDTESGVPWDYSYRSGRRNTLGLTNLGKALIHGMIARGMVIDIDHMSARSKADVLDICALAHYPVVASHIGLNEISQGNKRHEGQLLAAEADRIQASGGMVAIILHQGDLNEIDTWDTGGTLIPHTNGNTANTTVQAYLGAAFRMKGGPVAFGTDYNGFAGLPGPRFGPDASPGGNKLPSPPTRVVYPFTAATTGGLMDKGVIGNKTFDINVDGPAHVGMLPDLIAEFEVMGLTAADLDPLVNSAQGYIGMWLKATSKRSLDWLYTTSGIEHDQAIRAYGYTDMGIVGYFPPIALAAVPMAAAPLGAAPLGGARVNPRGALRGNVAVRQVVAQPDPTVEWYRMSFNGKHSYTSNLAERNQAVNNLGFTDEGTLGHLHTTQVAGTAPLYRLYRQEDQTSLLVTSDAARDDAVATNCFVLTDTLGYLLTAAVPAATPIYRLSRPT